MVMKDYYYFKQKDLLVNVQVDQSVVEYTSHREINLDEMIFVEHYIKHVIIKKLSMLKDFRFKIEYAGTSSQLVEEHKSFVDNLPSRPSMPDLFLQREARRDDLGFTMDDLGFIQREHGHFQDPQQHSNDADIKSSIEQLKAKADEDFCFDRIGDILRDRNEKHPEEFGYRMEELVERLKEYNSLSNKKVKITDLIK